MTSALEPKVIEPGQGRSVSLYDVHFEFKVEGADSGGSVAIIEVEIPPRTLVKPHRHTREDEFSYVLSGAVGARIGDREFEAVAGSGLVKPRNVPHAMWNTQAEPARILEIVSPAGLERYFELVAPVLRERGREWTERFYQLAEQYGLGIEDEWSDELQERLGIKL